MGHVGCCVGAGGGYPVGVSDVPVPVWVRVNPRLGVNPNRPLSSKRLEEKWHNWCSTASFIYSRDVPVPVLTSRRESSWQCAVCAMRHVGCCVGAGGGLPCGRKRRTSSCFDVEERVERACGGGVRTSAVPRACSSPKKKYTKWKKSIR